MQSGDFMHWIFLKLEALLTQSSNAEDLSAADWQSVFKINRLLHGFEIRHQNDDVIRARCNGEASLKSQ